MGRRATLLVLAGLTGCAGRAPANETGRPVQLLADPIVESHASADGLPAEWRSRFATADARGRAISYWLQCVPTVARLRADGRFGAAARAPRLIHCARTTDGVPIGGVYDIDSSFRTVRRLSVVRLDGNRPAYTASLDTLAIAREAKAARDVHKAVATAWAKQRRSFSVVPFTRDSGRVLEVWVLPRATRARALVTGGDMGYQIASDGSLAMLVDRRPTWKETALAIAGPLRVVSAGADVAAEADLATAHYQTALGRQVTVVTTGLSSVLEPGFDPTTGARVVWKHQRLVPSP